MSSFIDAFSMHATTLFAVIRSTSISFRKKIFKRIVFKDRIRAECFKVRSYLFVPIRKSWKKFMEFVKSHKTLIRLSDNLEKIILDSNLPGIREDKFRIYIQVC